jgi:hypothetical protein
MSTRRAYCSCGAFADPNFPAPKISVYEQKRHPWALPGDLDLEHLD